MDFERTLYEDSLDVLAHCLRPLSLVPGVMLAQSYAAHLVESVRCMSQVMFQQEGICFLDSFINPTLALWGKLH